MGRLAQRQKLFVPLNVARRRVGVVVRLLGKERGGRQRKGFDKVMDGPKQAKTDCQVVRNGAA